MKRIQLVVLSIIFAVSPAIVLGNDHDQGAKTNIGYINSINIEMPAPGQDQIGVCESTDGEDVIFLARRGCCSHHGGVCGCDNDKDRIVCCDGTYSPTCTCSRY